MTRKGRSVLKDGDAKRRSAIDPFEDVGNDTLAKMCQAQIFFSLLSSVALSYDE